MSLSAKQQFLMSRYGYKDKDFADYAQDHHCSLQVAIDRLFYHHVNIQRNQQHRIAENGGKYGNEQFSQ